MSNPMSPGSRTNGYRYAQTSAERRPDEEILVYARAHSGKSGDEAGVYAGDFLFGYQVGKLPLLPVNITPLQKKIIERVSYDSSMGDWSTLETLSEGLPSYFTKKDIQAAIDRCPLISYNADGVITECPDQADRAWMLENGFITYL
jgi:hypothetical protein